MRTPSTALLRTALAGRRAVMWTNGGLRPVRERLAGLGHPLADPERASAPTTYVKSAGWTWTGEIRECVAQWRGELHPGTSRLRAPWPPGTADRLWHTLTRIADDNPATETDALFDDEPVTTPASES